MHESVLTKHKSWDEYFMDIADMVSTRSTCLRRQVGAILVKDRHIISTGYNGSPRGYPNCNDTLWCAKDQLNIPSGWGHSLCVASHAEINTVAQAALHGISTKGTTLYTQWIPCSWCARILINAGIAEVVYSDTYPDAYKSLEMFDAADVIVRKIGGKRES